MRWAWNRKRRLKWHALRVPSRCATPGPHQQSISPHTITWRHMYSCLHEQRAIGLCRRTACRPGAFVVQLVSDEPNKRLCQETWRQLALTVGNSWEDGWHQPINAIFRCSQATPPWIAYFHFRASFSQAQWSSSEALTRLAFRAIKLSCVWHWQLTKTCTTSPEEYEGSLPNSCLSQQRGLSQ